jgi:hypothetical protein
MYAVGGTEEDREEADVAFLMNMRQVVMWETAGWYEDKERRRMVRQECFRQAKTYYTMVRTFGGLFFNKEA